MSREARIGGKLRRLRQERKLSQATMAEQLGISASYLNLLEHNQRPVTVPVLLKLTQRFSIDVQSLTAEDDSRLVSELMEAFADPLFDADDVKVNDLTDLVSASPNLGQALLTLYRAYRSGRTNATPAEAPEPLDGELGEVQAALPSEEVSDFIQQRRNHFKELEAAAEELWRDHELDIDNLTRQLVDILAQRFAVEVIIRPAGQMDGILREYNPITRQLFLSEMLPLSSRNFQLAHQIGNLGWRKQIELLASPGKFTSAEADKLACGALANYFAGAVLMPYERFLEAARRTRYDVEILQLRFRTSFEQVCHRLTTLRRPGAEGIPFHLLRVDIAGNLSKRFSASGIRIAGAFARPGLAHAGRRRLLLHRAHRRPHQPADRAERADPAHRPPGDRPRLPLVLCRRARLCRRSGARRPDNRDADRRQLQRLRAARLRRPGDAVIASEARGRREPARRQRLCAASLNWPVSSRPPPAAGRFRPTACGGAR